MESKSVEGPKAALDDKIARSPSIDNEVGEMEKTETVDSIMTYGLDPAYVEKAALVSGAMHTIGMSAWHYQMWMVCGFGWVVDNIAGYGLSVTYTPVSYEFNVPNVTLTGISYNLGAFIGAMFWGPMADIIGRRWAFNTTLFLVGICMVAAGGSNNIYTYGGLFGVVGFASGGNVPVAATVYLEFVPAKGYYLLTMLSAWWAVGAVVDSLIAWAFIGNYSCDMTVSDICLKADNMGWRYTLFTVGSLVIVLAAARFFIFRIPESPYFLLSRGRDAEVIEVIDFISKKAKKPCPLTLEQLKDINDRHGRDTGNSTIAPPLKEVFLSQFKQISLKSLKPLFGKPKLALQTCIIIWIWAAIGIAYPLYSFFLPTYLAAKFQAISYDYSLESTYRQYCYIAACTVPGPIIASFAIETRLGRRYTMAIGTLLSGVFLYLSTLAATNEAVVGFNCTATLVINFMFAIQYAYTPESFPSTIRATANGLCSMVGYVCGLAAPVIASQAGVSTNVPIYVSGALFLLTGLIMFALPIETATENRF
ncbi:hypothetical protein G7Z17_g2215 [Cylindrodendrum hubeiense]|uniref:Major facilitator superfamily (MFS) profile domain-containing protein n=1 Tax=Cylindrodendrum hubeiense TaxID=595255 RepID=A0A9P5LEN8_9HYPO|nr:hypothetical protein G7Z17_g2215 [Cylindrodendrum hubeiense]